MNTKIFERELGKLATQLQKNITYYPNAAISTLSPKGLGKLYKTVRSYQLGKLTEVPLETLSLQSYRKLTPEPLMAEIEKLAKGLKGVKVGILSATAFGGGVAEIEKSLIPLMRSLGIDARWYIMPGNEEFFNVTKGMHNGLQGADYELTKKAKNLYLKQNAKTARLMREVDIDIWEVQDPQPAAVISGNQLKRAIWRCHIDSSTPNPQVRDFLLPYLKQYNSLIFTLPEFVPAELGQSDLHYFAPTIDPLTIKNVPLDVQFCRAMLEALGVDSSRPLVTQVSRFDPWKDPMGVIDAYRLAKKEIPGLQLALVGSMAHDDPEGAIVYQQVKRHAKNDKDIKIYTNLMGIGQLEVNAFQTASNAIIQKSIREGFGLTVAEAMWKKTPVIGGRAGGITLQIKDGSDGYLVETPEECAQAIIELVKHPKRRKQFGEAAYTHTRANFLHPRLLRDHLKLYRQLLKK